MDFNVVGRTTDGFFRYQAWPTVTKDANGILYAAASGHRLGHVCPFGKDLMYISRDEGESWEGPIIINDTYMDDRDAGLYAWGDGNLVLTWFSLLPEKFDEREPRTPLLTTPLPMAARQLWKELPAEQCDAGAFMKVSHDGGKTWGEKIRVPLTSPHGPIRRKDGSLFFFGKVYLCPDETYPNRHICAAESFDEGKTWHKLGVVDLPQVDPAIAPEGGVNETHVHEPHAIELPDGTLLGAVRISGFGGHARNMIYTTRSTDGGRTWSKPEILDLVGAPPHLMLHSSGAVVLTYSTRVEPHTQRAKISWDGGLTWGKEIIVAPPSPDWDHGYPSTVELSDGSLLTVYYQKYPGDTYNSILSSRWELPAKE